MAGAVFQDWEITPGFIRVGNLLDSWSGVLEAFA